MDLIEHANSKRRMVVRVTAFAAVAAGIVFSLMIISEMALPTVNLEVWPGTPVLPKPSFPNVDLSM